MKAWLSEWHLEAIEQNEDIRAADWIAMALTMIEITIDTQQLAVEDRERVTYGLMAEVQKRISPSMEHAAAAH